ncbi:hypothetical protein D3C80_1711670 [compost metagenome]
MVADDGADVDGQQAGLPTEQQIVEAVAFLADQQHGFHVFDLGVQAPAHLEARREFGQRRLERCSVGVGADKLHAHEEQAGVAVVVLGRFFDVGALFEQEAGNSMHQPATVGAG